MIKFTKEAIEDIEYDASVEVIDRLELFVCDESNDWNLRVRVCKKLDLIYGTDNNSKETDDELLVDWVKALKLNGVPVGKVKLADGWGLCSVCNDAVVFISSDDDSGICKNCLKFDEEV